MEGVINGPRCFFVKEIVTSLELFSAGQNDPGLPGPGCVSPKLELQGFINIHHPKVHSDLSAKDGWTKELTTEPRKPVA